MAAAAASAPSPTCALSWPGPTPVRRLLCVQLSNHCQVAVSRAPGALLPNPAASSPTSTRGQSRLLGLRALSLPLSLPLFPTSLCRCAHPAAKSPAQHGRSRGGQARRPTDLPRPLVRPAKKTDPRDEPCGPSAARPSLVLVLPWPCSVSLLSWRDISSTPGLVSRPRYRVRTCNKGHQRIVDVSSPCSRAGWQAVQPATTCFLHSVWLSSMSQQGGCRRAQTR